MISITIIKGNPPMATHAHALLFLGLPIFASGIPAFSVSPMHVHVCFAFDSLGMIMITICASAMRNGERRR
jgi:hypothetical protein